MTGIYKITNEINGKAYIGQSICIEERFKQHKREAFYKNKRSNKILYQAFRKYGLENFSFEILEECTKEELDNREIYWIKYYNTFNDGYNLTMGGQGNSFTKDIPEEEVHKMWNEGKTVKEIKDFYKVKNITIKRRLSSCETYSEHEARVRAGKSITKLNDSLSKTRYEKQIIQYDLEGNIINKYNSVTEIKKKLGYDSRTIEKCIEGNLYSSHNFRWGLEGEELISKEEIDKKLFQERSKKHQIITDEEIIEALQNTKSIRQALLFVGLNDSGANYKRVKRILEQYPEYKQK